MMGVTFSLRDSPSCLFSFHNYKVVSNMTSLPQTLTFTGVMYMLVKDSKWLINQYQHITIHTQKGNFILLLTIKFISLHL